VPEQHDFNDVVLTCISGKIQTSTRTDRQATFTTSRSPKSRWSKTSTTMSRNHQVDRRLFLPRPAGAKRPAFWPSEVRAPLAKRVRMAKPMSMPARVARTSVLAQTNPDLVSCLNGGRETASSQIRDDRSTIVSMSPWA
jgi:hypothetical protein